MADPKRLYTDWHWGIEPKEAIDWKDPDYPKGALIECGRLVELHLRQPGLRKDTIIKLDRTEANNSHLCFDPEHRFQRLYILSAKQFQERMRRELLEKPKPTKLKNPVSAMSLNEMAAKIGGRHKTPDYPNVRALPVGVLTHVVYACEKKGDKYSFYIHKLGEESGIRPWLAVDQKGRVWIVGGAYVCPSPGITD
jgi:hypothetical protein